jgi:hypothetical protein
MVLNSNLEVLFSRNFFRSKGIRGNNHLLLLSGIKGIPSGMKTIPYGIKIIPFGIIVVFY